MYKLLHISVIIILSLIRIPVLISGELMIPDRLDENWVAEKPVKIFSGSELFNHINGAAELFLEFGFEYVTVCKYRNENLALDLEVYKMDNTISALGIYLNKTAKQTPLAEIHARNTANNYQIVVVKGPYIIFVNNFSGNDELVSLMSYLSVKIVNQIKETEIVDLFSILPKENILIESMFIFRGPLGLQPVFTFGKGDIMLQRGKVFGFGANYELPSGKSTTRLVIPYPNQQTARQAYQNLLTNFDPYHKILHTQDTYFTFKDFKKEFGIVRIDENRILIQVHLSKEPE